MAGLTFTIGTHSFLSLDGEPGLLKTVVEVMTLPYYDGEAVRSMGIHSEPFTMTSCVDLADYVAAENKLYEYAALIGQSPVQFEWRSVSFSALALVQVLDVRASKKIPAGSLVGGLNLSNGSDGCMLYADWLLRLVPL